MNDSTFRKANRLKHYDYSSDGVYFLTICMKDRRRLLSMIDVGANCVRPVLTQIGQLVKNEIDVLSKTYNSVVIDKYVIMPNHIHLILVVVPEREVTEGGVTELGPTGGGRTQFAPTGSEGTGSGATQSVPTGSLPTESGATQSVPTGSVSTESGATESGATESGATGSRATQSVPTGSVSTESGTTQSVPTESVSTESGATQSVPTGSRRTQFAPTVSRIVKQFKGSITKQVGIVIWQKSFHDHIIRDEQDYQNHWRYIDENPARWAEDEYYEEDHGV